MIESEYVLNSDDDCDSDDGFLLSLAIHIPRLRRYPERPCFFTKYTDVEFRERFRFSNETVDKLVELFEQYLAPKTKRCNAISTLNQICIALRFLATGCFQLTCGDLFNCHKTTICRKLPRVLKKIALFAQTNSIIKMPDSENELRRTKYEFYKVARFPGIIGAIDCTHVKIQSPGGDVGEAYRNRKGYFSINVQCVSDANLNILDIEARWPGSVHDQTIFENSFLMTRFCRNDFGTSILLGDGGYANRNYLLTPLSTPRTMAENNYQKAHIRSRNSVERLFGVWKRRFPALSLGFRVKVETLLTAIVASAILHNLANKLNDINDFEEVDLNLVDLEVADNDTNSPNSSRRTALIQTHFRV